MDRKIGSILKHIISLDDAVLDDAAFVARLNNVKIGSVLIDKGIPETAVYEALAEQFSMKFLPSIENHITIELLKELPVDLFKDKRCIPLSSNETTMKIAVCDPLDLDIVLQAALSSNLIIDSILISPTEMKRAHSVLFEGDSIFKQSAGKISREYDKQTQVDESLSLDEIRQRTESEPVVKLATLIFNEAIKVGASDIHIEPSEFNAVVRFRIDGMLKQHTEVSKGMYSPLTSRIKILADVDIAEKRIPQDGRIRYVADGQTFDFRVSTLPTHFGEKTVIRVLKHDKTLMEMRNLGFSATELQRLSDLVEKPQGMIFVTGPTGSGKSSTLFACLNRIRHKAINITTIENPIEYKLEGINQVQINEKAGVTFSTALRSILRQDPDVILIGEIRDNETAQIAVQASQTGHLVLSTLHTNDAISAITRLRDLSIPGFLISSSILAIVAQRLVRVLCPHCKTKAELTDDIKHRWSLLLGSYQLPDSYGAVGCDHCNKTGYKGRMGIYEIVTINEKLRALIADNAPELVLRKTFRDDGFATLIQDGISKVEMGFTTPEEILRVVLVEDTIQISNSAD
jgi:type IV pilus assembly protein PilB